MRDLAVTSGVSQLFLISRIPYRPFVLGPKGALGPWALALVALVSTGGLAGVLFRRGFLECAPQLRPPPFSTVPGALLVLSLCPGPPAIASARLAWLLARLAVFAAGIRNPASSVPHAVAPAAAGTAPTGPVAAH